MVRFVQEHVAVFLCLCNLGSKGRYKATTHKGFAQGVVGGVCSEHTVLFLCLYKLASKGRYKATTHKGLAQGWGMWKSTVYSSQTVFHNVSSLVQLCSSWRSIRCSERKDRNTPPHKRYFIMCRFLFSYVVCSVLLGL